LFESEEATNISKYFDDIDTEKEQEDRDDLNKELKTHFRIAEEIDFVKCVTLSTYINTLEASKTNTGTCVCGKKVTSGGKLLHLCGCEVHAPSLHTFWTLAPGFSKIDCPLCKKSYYAQVWMVKPDDSVM